MRNNYGYGRRGKRRLRRTARARRAGRAALTGLFVFCLLFSVTALVRRSLEERETRRIQASNRSLLAPSATDALAAPAAPAAPEITPAPVAPVAPAATPSPAMLPAAQKLREKNGDLVGWLKVGGIEQINFAVVQRNNLFYLNHDFNGRKNGNGAAFLDELCSILPRDDNLIIYAHNMQNGEMFGKLNRLFSPAQIKSDPFTEFSTLYEKGTYLPLAIINCDTEPSAKDFFAFYENRFAQPEAFDAHVARAKALSAVFLPFDAREGDELLTLVTCDAQRSERRIVVLLRKLRADETQKSVLSQLE